MLVEERVRFKECYDFLGANSMLLSYIMYLFPKHHDDVNSDRLFIDKEDEA